MTPAILYLEKQKINHCVHEYQHDANCDSYGLEAVDALGLDPERVFKTLIVQLNTGQLAVACIPVGLKLNMKLMAKACGAKKAEMALPKLVERSSGYVLGGVSPLAQKKALPSVIHESVSAFSTIFVSGGRRGLEVELAPNDLKTQINADYALICS